MWVVGAAASSRLVHLSSGKVVEVRAKAGDILFGHWAGMQASPFCSLYVGGTLIKCTIVYVYSLS